MHSTRKPPFAPPPLPGEEDAREITNVVRLRQGRRNSEGDPIQDSDEPPWRQAFVLADGVKATRTPDKVIRARNGHAEPPTTQPEAPSRCPLPTRRSIRPIIDEEAVGAPEPAVRSQIAELRSALASEDPVSERLASLADREAALAERWLRRRDWFPTPDDRNGNTASVSQQAPAADGNSPETKPGAPAGAGRHCPSA